MSVIPCRTLITLGSDSDSAFRVSERSLSPIWRSMTPVPMEAGPPGRWLGLAWTARLTVCNSFSVWVYCWLFTRNFGRWRFWAPLNRELRRCCSDWTMVTVTVSYYAVAAPGPICGETVVRRYEARVYEWGWWRRTANPWFPRHNTSFRIFASNSVHPPIELLNHSLCS